VEGETIKEGLHNMLETNKAIAAKFGIDLDFIEKKSDTREILIF